MANLVRWIGSMVQGKIAFLLCEDILCEIEVGCYLSFPNSIVVIVVLTNFGRAIGNKEKLHVKMDCQFPTT